MSNSEQKLAIVTGGNRGLGLEACRQLARQGYVVVLAARDLAQAQHAAASLASAGEVQAAQLDVTNETSIRAFAARARAELGPLHALVNNAGVSLNGFDASVVQGTLAVNFFGALRVLPTSSPRHGQVEAHVARLDAELR